MITGGKKQNHARKSRIPRKQFFMTETKWLGHELDKNGNKPIEEKVEAKRNLKPPENTKEVKSFPGAKQEDLVWHISRK